MKWVPAVSIAMLGCALAACSGPRASVLASSHPADQAAGSQQSASDAPSGSGRATNTFGDSTDPAANEAAQARDRNYDSSADRQATAPSQDAPSPR